MRAISLQLIFTFLLIGCGTIASAQIISTVDSANAVIAGAKENQQRVDTLVADSAKYIIRSVTYAGNKTTKQFILEREMTFHAGDTLTGAQLRKQAEVSKENLLNTSLFNFVTVAPYCSRDSVLPPCSRTDIVVSVKERWYTWPSPVFEVAEQNFNTWYRNGHNLQRATYGFLLWRYNFRGRKESVALICRFGYAKQFGGVYDVPYVNKKHTLGITVSGTYTLSHEVSYATRRNEFFYYKNSDDYIRKEVSGHIMFTYRRSYFIRHTLDFRYSGITVNDTIVDLNSDYLGHAQDKLDYFTISYRLTNDHRDIKAYPLNGSFQEFEMTKHGLGLLKNETVNVFYITVGARQYAEIADRVYLAAMFRYRVLLGPPPPYYHQRALGFGTFVRGYEYYVIDGQSYAIGKVSLRYALLTPHVFKFPWLPIEKFNTFHLAIYGGIYGDAAYVTNIATKESDHNTLANSLLYGYGAGIDLVTYYDVALRIEYTINRQMESGLFLHLGAAF